ncbi:MAG: N-acetylmuramoyl-L-alanine amidase [Prevotellaceae bacterium]|nr:N-acetylmuramoyl-L-alanine amidase [Candidatus Faecinaster equi]
MTFPKHKIVVLLALMLLCVNSNAFILVLDAGHGGHDSGAIGTYSKEKNINLNVVLKVGELIKQNCPDVKVIYTRKTDVFVKLYERAAIAQRAKADLFISIHTNAVKNNSTVGSETYFLGMAKAKNNLDIAKRENSVILYENDYKQKYAGFNPNSAESYIIFEFMQDQYMKQSATLAKFIQQQYASIANRLDRGVKQNVFLVLKEASMPSILTELGFISTPSEEQYLNSVQGINELSQCIFQGFLKYKNYAEGNNSNPIVSDNKAESDNIENSTTNKTKIQTESNIEQSTKTDNKETTNENIKKSQISSSTTTSSKNNDSQIIFKIQILSSSKKLSQNNTQFKGLSPIDFYSENGMYKYTYGSTESYNDILTLKKTITSNFPDCFIIAFQGKKKITISEAKRLQQHK